MSAELPITGYLDRFSRRPGETFQAKVSLRDGGRYRARLVRVVCGDPNPAGPGMKLLDMADRFDIAVEGRRQPIRLGSYGLVPRGPRRDPAAPCTWTALVWPGLLRAAPAAVLAEEGGAGPLLSLALAADGAQVTVSGAAGPVTVSTGAPLRARCWYRVWASTDPASGRVVVGQVPLGPSWGVADRATGEAAVPGLRLPDGTGPRPRGRSPSPRATRARQARISPARSRTRQSWRCSAIAGTMRWCGRRRSARGCSPAGISPAASPGRPSRMSARSAARGRW